MWVPCVGPGMHGTLQRGLLVLGACTLPQFDSTRRLPACCPCQQLPPPPSSCPQPLYPSLSPSLSDHCQWLWPWSLAECPVPRLGQAVPGDRVNVCVCPSSFIHRPLVDSGSLCPAPRSVTRSLGSQALPESARSISLAARPGLLDHVVLQFLTLGGAESCFPRLPISVPASRVPKFPISHTPGCIYHLCAP